MKDDNYYSLFPDQRPHFDIDPLDKIRENVELLCVSLKKDYIWETKRSSERMIRSNVNIEKYKQNLKDIEDDKIDFIIDDFSKSSWFFFIYPFCMLNAELCYFQRLDVEPIEM